MFDIGFSELLVIAVVALIVIGPERLPKVARTAGHLLGRLQRYVNDVKSDISREMELDELRKLQTSVQDAARSIENSVSKEISETESELARLADDTASAAQGATPDSESDVAAAAASSQQLELGLESAPRQAGKS